jgi:hypothetical protein
MDLQALVNNTGLGANSAVIYVKVGNPLLGPTVPMEEAALTAAGCTVN